MLCGLSMPPMRAGRRDDRGLSLPMEKVFEANFLGVHLRSQGAFGFGQSFVDLKSLFVQIGREANAGIELGGLVALPAALPLLCEPTMNLLRVARFGQATVVFASALLICRLFSWRELRRDGRRQGRGRESVFDEGLSPRLFTLPRGSDSSTLGARSVSKRCGFLKALAFGCSYQREVRLRFLRYGIHTSKDQLSIESVL